MIVKNCSNCGTTNALDATACMVCSGTTFLEPHTPVGDADGHVVTDTAAPAPEVVVVVMQEHAADATLTLDALADAI